MKMRNYTSDGRLKEKYNKEQNKFLSKRIKNIKATINTKSPDSFYNLKTVNNNRSHKVKGNICK
jgi:hypothetical protein